jgi:hypothetical protein
MSRKDMITLKLQMGINPSTQIAPNMLLAMWQQLKLESAKKRVHQSKAKTGPSHVA